MRFFEQLARRSSEIDSLVCVGLDPDFRKRRIEDVAAFNRAIIEATTPYAACYKPNIAFYEQFGLPGLRALEATLAAIPRASRSSATLSAAISVTPPRPTPAPCSNSGASAPSP
ncbi:MAG: hypothetical protein M5U18_15290 [Dehalococcoidia bacterium]|nr:hypothetical protein [Dehalococcoidia bacterium]